MQQNLVIDSSSLFALERAQLLFQLKQIPFILIIPPAVKEEIEKGNCKELLDIVTIQTLKGRTLKKAHALEYFNIGKGEAQCCALALYLGIDFIICDDRTFIRQRFFSYDKDMKRISIVGFAFFLHLFHKEKLIDDVWKYFYTIIKLCHWERSEVEDANFTFLKGKGY